MPNRKPYLLIFLLLASISIWAQEMSTTTLAGEWTGFDSKGQKVTFVFTEQGMLQTMSMDKTNSLHYSIKTNANSTYLLLTPISGKKTKTTFKWPFVFTGNDHLKIDFLDIPSIIFKRKEEDKIKLSRNSIFYGDSIIQYTTVISYGKDSVKAIRTVKVYKPVQIAIADTILPDSLSSDQLELKTGWSGSNASFGVTFDFAPSTGTFFIDKLEVHKAVDQQSYVCITYWKNKLLNFFSLNKEDFVYPADAEKALSTLERFTKLSR